MGTYVNGILLSSEEIAALRKDWFIELMESAIDTDLGPAVLVRSMEDT